MMSKVKEWATDLAEVYLDELANDIDTLDCLVLMTSIKIF
jgi:hypothetical protein